MACGILSEVHNNIRVIASLTKEGEAISLRDDNLAYFVLHVKDCFVSANWRILAMTAKSIKYTVIASLTKEGEAISLSDDNLAYFASYEGEGGPKVTEPCGPTFRNNHIFAESNL